ncbi:diaminopimelate epimerase [Dokdonella fugitiva]|jgi:diaminopimelate epimerase|uniref:Diaminopimelate epimerase n=1 Tax=Dokdonella fugitiva TaxID=328517 RepID=A0A4R2IGS7_9GAMM|nr:diaminopimelate epimerase [Dokdonella fugitiva]TCO43039.1 diaminopimelate epimerase [Dokdonella fugitiva]
MPLRFSKMHGIGNDFVVVDARAAPFTLDAAAIRRLGDRHFGVGFDQLLTIEPARDPSCSFAYGIWNTDGTRAGQCGNGVRCVAAWLARAGELGPGMTRLESPSGPVAVELCDDGSVRVDMGEPRFAPAEIPLVADAQGDMYAIDVAGRSVELGAVSMGNPHALVEVDDVAAAPVAVLGPQVEYAPAFPQRCNVGFAEIVSRGAIRLRVWERGVGETLACGSGACAAVAVLRRRAKVDAMVRVALPGGELEVRWDGPGHPVWMRGPAAFVFDGEIAPATAAATTTRKS